MNPSGDIPFLNSSIPQLLNSLTVLYEDNHCLAVAKPAPLLTQSAASAIPSLEGMVKAYLKERYHKAGNVYLGIPHRLDRPVSGVIVFAKTKKAARKISRHYVNVLLAGPTGSGKELVAHAIHQMSPVANHRFAVCNCSAIVDTLLESQLFGHLRGAFTGATETRAGLFEYANEGTVFLDEVGETSLAMQAKLLRVIQNREIQRVCPYLCTVNWLLARYAP